MPTMLKVTPTAALFAKKPFEVAPAVELAEMVDVRPLGVKKVSVDRGVFEGKRVVDPPSGKLDMAEGDEVVVPVSLDGEDAVLLEEGVDEVVDEDVEVEEVVDVVASEDWEVEVDFEEDVEGSLDVEDVVKEVGEETGVGLDDFVDWTGGDCESVLGVGEGVEVGVGEGLLGED